MKKMWILALISLVFGVCTPVLAGVQTAIRNDALVEKILANVARAFGNEFAAKLRKLPAVYSQNVNVMKITISEASNGKWYISDDFISVKNNSRVGDIINAGAVVTSSSPAGNFVEPALQQSFNSWLSFLNSHMPEYQNGKQFVVKADVIRTITFTENFPDGSTNKYHYGVSSDEKFYFQMNCCY